jgi:hypothetical protein
MEERYQGRCKVNILIANYCRSLKRKTSIITDKKDQKA